MPDSEAKTPDLLILHQQPDGLRSAQNLKDYLSRNPKLPVLFMNGQHTDVNKFNELQTVLAIDQGESATTTDASPIFNTNFSAFNTAEFEAQNIQSWPPPLQVIFGDYQSVGNAEVLFSQKKSEA